MCRWPVACRACFDVCDFLDSGFKRLIVTRDPTVGAQYRWSANFAPFAPRFWGLLQGLFTAVSDS